MQKRGNQCSPVHTDTVTNTARDTKGAQHMQHRHGTGADKRARNMHVLANMRTQVHV